jgi:hypothetical protein
VLTVVDGRLGTEVVERVEGHVWLMGELGKDFVLFNLVPTRF